MSSGQKEAAGMFERFAGLALRPQEGQAQAQKKQDGEQAAADAAQSETHQDKELDGMEYVPG
jgi:hypothetical protein